MAAPVGTSFVGNNRECAKYSSKRIDQWLKKINKGHKGRIQAAIIYPNNGKPFKLQKKKKQKPVKIGDYFDYRQIYKPDLKGKDQREQKRERKKKAWIFSGWIVGKENKNPNAKNDIFVATASYHIIPKRDKKYRTEFSLNQKIVEVYPNNYPKKILLIASILGPCNNRRHSLLSRFCGSKNIAKWKFGKCVLVYSTLCKKKDEGFLSSNSNFKYWDKVQCKLGTGQSKGRAKVKRRYKYGAHVNYDNIMNNLYLKNFKNEKELNDYEQQQQLLPVPVNSLHAMNDNLLLLLLMIGLIIFLVSFCFGGLIGVITARFGYNRNKYETAESEASEEREEY